MKCSQSKVTPPATFGAIVCQLLCVCASPRFRTHAVVVRVCSPSLAASKRSAREFHMSIGLSDERFARRLSHCAAQLAASRAAEAAEAAEEPPAFGVGSPLGSSATVRTTAATSRMGSVAELGGDYDAMGATTMNATSSPAADAAGGSSSSTGLWSWFRGWFSDGQSSRTSDAGEDEALPACAAKLVLVASTPFEADAWASAIREAKAALVQAAEMQHWALVRALATAGRDVNYREDGNQRTALHYAAGYGELPTARCLVQLGAHVNARDRAGMTPLGWACLKGHLALSQLLLKADADPLIKAHSGVLVGKSAITLARLHGSQSQTAARRAQELVHQLLLHCGAACFQVHHMLGQGGFGKVLAVTRSDSGERFAMKAILKHASPSASTNQKMVKQAQVERKILRRVTHPFIIDLHCAFQTHDKLLLVLEICPGGDLKSHVSRCGRFPPEVAAFCSSQVFSHLLTPSHTFSHLLTPSHGGGRLLLVTGPTRPRVPSHEPRHPPRHQGVQSPRISTQSPLCNLHASPRNLPTSPHLPSFFGRLSPCHFSRHRRPA